MKKLLILLLVCLCLTACGGTTNTDKKDESVTLYCEKLYLYDNDQNLKGSYNAGEIGSQDTKIVINGDAISYDYYYENELVGSFDGTISDCELDDDTMFCNVEFVGNDMMYFLSYTEGDYEDYTSLIVVMDDTTFLWTFSFDKQVASDNVNKVVTTDKVRFDETDTYAQMVQIIKDSLKDYDVTVEYNHEDSIITMVVKPDFDIYTSLKSNFSEMKPHWDDIVGSFNNTGVEAYNVLCSAGYSEVGFSIVIASSNDVAMYGSLNGTVVYNIADEWGSSSSTPSTRFTNKYGTSTTLCHHSGCNNYIASSGDTWDCVSHSNTCLNCSCYIDCDATYCMTCLSGAISSSSFSNKYGTATTVCHHSGCNNYIASSGDTWDCVSHSNTCLNCFCYIDCDAMYCMSCLTGK